MSEKFSNCEKMKKGKHIINLVLVAIALAMGVAVVVLSILDEELTTNELIRMLGIAVVALGIFTLNKEEKEDKVCQE